MPTTYSINIGQLIEATRKPDIFSVLKDLPDNTKKLISPRDVRDAFLSVWANSTIKLTTPGNYSTSEYIGVDSGNPDNKIGFLSGTNKNLFPYAPYIESQSVTGSRVDFNINNPSIGGGAISIYSNTGRVSINGIVFPTLSESAGSASNGRILRYYGTYPNGYLKWDESITTLTNIGTPGITTSIYGENVLVNNYPIEFWNDDLVPVTIGGVTQGSSFPKDSFTAGGFTTPGTGQNWPMTEVIRKVLYPYIEPTLQLSVSNLATGTTYAENGYNATFSLVYSITSYARVADEYVSHFALRNSSNTIFEGSSFSVIPGTTLNSTFTYATNSNTSFKLVASTIPGVTNSVSHPFGFTFSSATASISFINPIFCGFHPSVITNTLGLLNLFSNSKKKILPYPGASNSVVFSATGSGYFYFAYPSSFTTNVVRVKDPNGFIIHDTTLGTSSAFGNTFSTISSPIPYSGLYRLWRITLPTAYSGSGEFEFIF